MQTTTPTGIPADLPALVRRAVKAAEKSINGRLDIDLPGHPPFSISNGKPGRVSHIRIRNLRALNRLLRDGWLGFSEAYLDGDWDSDDLQAFMDHMHEVDFDLYDRAFAGGPVVRALEMIRHWFRRNSRAQARRNIAHHYDLGNAFYALWLDETMTYSSALFRTGQEPLERAQIQKYESMVDQMGARPGDHVLEIGCGWGGFAEYAARERGLRVTGLTISQAQHDYAVDRIRRAGLDGQVQIKLQDYRDERGSYDGIASIEMFEAVGERYWPVYFDTLRARLKPGRNATLQIITVADRRWEVYRREVDFIQKYIFPGGMLPSPAALRAEIARAGLALKGSVEFGTSYDQTLRRWHETFNARWAEVAKMGFDDRFRRMWNFYLTSCASSFATANCDVTQITVTRPA